MQVQEYFKVENKEFALKNSGSRCSECGYSLANFEVAMRFTVCCDCQHNASMEDEDWDE